MATQVSWWESSHSLLPLAGNVGAGRSSGGPLASEQFLELPLI